MARRSARSGASSRTAPARARAASVSSSGATSSSPDSAHSWDSDYLEVSSVDGPRAAKTQAEGRMRASRDAAYSSASEADKAQPSSRQRQRQRQRSPSPSPAHSNNQNKRTRKDRQTQESGRSLEAVEAELGRIKDALADEVTSRAAERQRAAATERELRQKVATYEIAEGRKKLGQLAKKIELETNQSRKLDLEEEKLKQSRMVKELTDEAKTKFGWAPEE